MADESVKQTMIKSGFERVLDSGPEAAERMVASERARWTPIIKATRYKRQLQGQMTWTGVIY